MVRCLLALALALAVVVPGSLRADERYVAVLFASQSEPVRANRTHSFLAAARLQDGVIAETVNISWMPESLKICSYCLNTNKGVNLGLVDTIEWATADGQCVKMWGPYEIDCELYAKLVAQESRLNSGRVRYQCFDRYTSSRRACNCFHAITDSVRHTRAMYPLFWFGHAATENIVRQWRWRGWLREPLPGDWAVVEALGARPASIPAGDLAAGQPE